MKCPELRPLGALALAALCFFAAGLATGIVRFRASDAAAHIAGFYHVYAEGGEYERIVKEQLLQLRVNGLLGATRALYYTAVGAKSRTFRIEDFLGGNARGPRYFQMAPERSGGEEITLERLQQYCRSFPTHRVYYLHTKGAYHAHSTNENLRRLLTKTLGSARDACLEALRQGASVCGLRFSPAPHFHYPGNFWWARCDYIAGLVSPLRLREAPPASLVALDAICAEGDVGRGRYASEHWVTLGLNVNATDVLPGMDFERTFTWGYKRGIHHDWTPSVALAPRAEISIPFWLAPHRGSLVELASPSNEDRLDFLARFNDPCHVSMRSHQARELGELYGEAALEGEGASPTAARWLAQIERVCTATEMFGCDAENRLRLREGAATGEGPLPMPGLGGVRHG